MKVLQLYMNGFFKKYVNLLCIWWEVQKMLPKLVGASKMHPLQICVGVEILLLILTFESTGSVWHYLRLKHELSKWLYHLHIIDVSPCSFRLNSFRSIMKCASKASFQSHLVFHYVWGWFFSLRKISILALRSKKSRENFTTVEASNSRVAG